MKKTLEGLKAFALSLALFLVPVLGYIALEKFIELYEKRTKEQFYVILGMQIVGSGLALEFLGRLFGIS